MLSATGIMVLLPETATEVRVTSVSLSACVLHPQEQTDRPLKTVSAVEDQLQPQSPQVQQQESEQDSQLHQDAAAVTAPVVVEGQHQQVAQAQHQQQQDQHHQPAAGLYALVSWPRMDVCNLSMAALLEAHSSCRLQ